MSSALTPAVAAVAVIAIAQLGLGANPLVVLLACATIVVGLFPILRVGRDLYTILSALVMVQYVGAGFVVKTIYAQPLDLHLSYPLESHGLTFIVVATMSAVSLAARRLDRRRSWLPAAQSIPALRTVSIVGAICGGAAQLVVIFTGVKGFGFGAGPVYVTAAMLSHLFELGVTCEVAYCIAKNPNNPISGRLILLMAIAAMLALFSNQRVFLINSLIAAGVMLFLNHGLRLRTAAAGVAVLALVTSVVSPIMLSVRFVREGKTAGEFIELAATNVVRSVTDPAYFEELSARQRAIEAVLGGRLPYDYYGDRSNLQNRLAYVGLLDAVYAGTKQHELIGLGPAASEVYGRSVPSFLVKQKAAKLYNYGDWLSWQMGMSELGRVYAANFGLPMEGLATFGFLGLLAYPWLFVLPVLLVLARMSSLRVAHPTSVFLVAASLNSLMEGQTDSFVSLFLRVVPVLGLATWAIYTFANSQDRLSRRAAVAATPRLV